MTLLATLEDFQRSQGLDPDPTDVAGLIALEGASAAIRTWCGRTFDLAAADEVLLDGSGSRELVLPEAPVQSVTDVSVTDWGGTETALTTADYVLDASAGILWRAWPDVWTTGHGNVALTYDHGYVLPGEVGANLPEDIQLVCIQIASRVKVRSENQGRTVSAEQEQIGTYSHSVTYETQGTTTLGMADLTEIERAILQRFRHVEAE